MTQPFRTDSNGVQYLPRRNGKSFDTIYLDTIQYTLTRIISNVDINHCHIIVIIISTIIFFSFYLVAIVLRQSMRRNRWASG